MLTPAIKEVVPEVRFVPTVIPSCRIRRSEEHTSELQPPAPVPTPRPSRRPGFGGPLDLCATNALLGRKLEGGRFAFRRGACNGAPVLIEQRERHADSRDQGSRP